MKLHLTLIIIVMATFLKCDRAIAQPKHLISVTIEWADFNIETIVDVSCNEFRNAFKDGINTKSLSNYDSISELTEFIKHFKKERNYKTIDVRGILTLNYPNGKKQYCFDKFGHFYNNGKLLYNLSLMAFIKGIIYAKYAK